MRIILAFILIVAFVLALGVMGYKVLEREAKENLAFNAQWAALHGVIDDVRAEAEEIIKKLRKGYKRLRRQVVKTTGLEEKPSQVIELHLKHGGVMRGKFLSKTRDGYTIDYKGQEYEIPNDRIKRIEYKTQKELEWPYEHDVVAKRTNTIVLDGEITDVTDEAVTVLFREGGGELEMEIDRKDIEHLMFAPVYNKEDEEKEKGLKELLPEMKVYKEGNITIFTDSQASSVKSYKRMLVDRYSEIYLKFFPLFKGRSPRRQTLVVVFDDYEDYWNHALADLVPPWLAVGYFSPTDNVLYAYDLFGEKVEKWIFEALVAKTGKQVDEIRDQIKSRIDDNHHYVVDGIAENIKNTYAEAYSFYKGMWSERTAATIRHEFTHGLFHNWGLQNIVTAKSPIDEKKIIDKKKEFLDTDDPHAKKRLFEQLVRLGKEEEEYTEITVAESWLAEGLATYSEPAPLGSINRERLFYFQEAVRNNELSPIEFLTVFSRGSFVGMTHKAKLNAYAQSWAFTTFLMAEYPNEFMHYQARIADEKPEEGSEADLLDRLLEPLEKDLPALEREFREYMSTAYEEIQDPDVELRMKWLRIWSDKY